MTDPRSKPAVAAPRSGEISPATVLEQLPYGAVVVDPRGAILYRNRAAASALPDAADMPTLFRSARFLGSFAGWEAELARLCSERREIQLQCVMRPVQGSGRLFVTLRCSPLVDERAGTVIGAVVLLEPVTWPDESADPLGVSQRLTTLGKLAARVAHELNNPLDGILRYVNLAIRTLGDTSESKLKSYLAESRTGLMRMVHIIGDLLEYSRSSGDMEEADVNEVIEQALRAHADAAESNRVVVAADFQQARMPRVRGSRLFQVCANLIRNAIDAMPDGGRLTVTSGVVGSEVVIKVADTGVGLPDDPEKLFEPFYTTKEAGKGTGLGLAICRDFLRDLGGTIHAEPNDGQGSVFIVRFPVEQKRPAGSRQHSADEATHRTGQDAKDDPPVGSPPTPRRMPEP